MKTKMINLENLDTVERVSLYSTWNLSTRPYNVLKKIKRMNI